MSRNDKKLEQLLDQAVEEIRDDLMSRESEQATADRVWARVAQELENADAARPERQQIRDCEDFQALIPAQLQGALNDAKKMLFEDHVAECLPCRKALKQARSGGRARKSEPTVARVSWVSKASWRFAAAAVVVLAVLGLSFNTDLLKVETGGVIHIQSIDGDLYHVTQEGTVPVQVGQEITLGKGEGLRTAKGSRAMIRLEDASEVEMRERSQVGVIEQAYFWNRDDTDAVLGLERGSVIIEASEQGSGHLYVDTADSRVAVTGTVFSVNNGIKGTRVSVIEGEVEVDYTGGSETLTAGEQVTSRPGLARVPVEEEIAWSQNLDKHLALLHEFSALSREIDAVINPGVRYSTELLEMAPEDTVVYIGIPNISDSLADAYGVLENKIGSSPALKEWWDETVVPHGGDVMLQKIISKAETYGANLGEEIALTLHMTDEGGVDSPLLLAKLTDEAAFKQLIQDEVAENAEIEDGDVRIVEGFAPDLSGPDAEMYVWLREDLVALAFDKSAIRAFESELQLKAVGKGPAGANLKQRLAERYDNGVELVIGVDIQRIMSNARKQHPDDEQVEAELSGFNDMRHLVGERKEAGDNTENRIELTFGSERQGIAGWLDTPAPMGSLEFISPEATFAAGFVMREPATLVDELFDTLGSMDDGFNQELADLQDTLGIDIREDVAAPLGGEFTFALDGPVLPIPAWKLVVEVYNPAQLQQTLHWAVEQVNQLAADAGREGLTLTSETSGGNEFHKLTSVDTGFSIQYVYVDGYMVAGPSQAMINQALQTRDSGVTITGSDRFTSMLPQDGEVNFSGVVYQNLGALLGPLVKIGAAASKLTQDQMQIAQELSAEARPSLIVAYGGKDSITLVFTHEGGLLSSGVASFFSLKGLMGVKDMVGQSVMQMGN